MHDSGSRRGWYWAAGWVVVCALIVGGCSDDRIAVSSDDLGPLGTALGVDERISIDGLSGPVDAVRDQWGRTHIYATNVPDAMRVEGYLVARDRPAQMEIMRRFATGRVAEVFGALDASQIETDIGFRMLGMGRVAEAQYQAADGEVRAILDAYADGVSQLFAEIQSEERPLARGIKMLLPKHFTPWSASDSLAFARLLEWQLSYDTDDIDHTALRDDLRLTFSPTDSDPAVQLRSGMERDLMRFAAPDDATTIPGFSATSLSGSGPQRASRASDIAGPSAAVPWSPTEQAAASRRRTLIHRAAGFLRGMRLARAHFAPEGDFGSNNWAISASRSASGHAMVASDPHLSLGSPATFWPVSIHVRAQDGAARDSDLQIGGIAFPGVPGIILGHNERVAWGATVTGYDVTDIYQETLSSDGKSVMYQGQAVPIETVDEVIALPDGSSYTYPVQIVPHHGPIIPNIVDGKVVPPDPAVGALSVRWTGFELTDEMTAIFGLLRAGDVDEARTALKGFDVGGQNWMLGDTGGNIAWTSHVLVPEREPAALSWDAQSYDGQLPCFILPGDGSADWTGFWGDDEVPWAKNPPTGYLATANNDPVGGTVDNDPSNDLRPGGGSGYLACSFSRGFREGTIQGRIDAFTAPLSLEDMSAIQGDVRSPIGSRLVPALLLAIDNAQQESATPGTHPDLSAVVGEVAYDSAAIAEVKVALEAWRDGSGYAAESGVNPDDNQPLLLTEPEGRAAQATVIFNAWLVRLLTRVLGDELGRVGHPAGTGHDIAALLHLVEADPATLATYDPVTGDSSLWDDLDTPQTESRQERMIRALLDALGWLQAELGGDMATWRWGQLHTLRFEPLVSVWALLANPLLDDPVFPDGFPRHGDMFVVDAANFSWRKEIDQDLSFHYGSGPNQRFVIDMAADALDVKNALPGGAVADAADPHFADQAELWRRNQVHAVPFARAEVIAAAESRTVLKAP